METHFAPAGRASLETLGRDIQFISRNPVIDAVMRSVGGLLSVLNAQRQILAINDTLLAHLGIEDAGQVFGLRPGEALGCRYASDPPDGCGTTRYCGTCGAAIAMLASLETQHPSEQDCAITAIRNGRPADLTFHVRADTISLNQDRYILLFLQDTTLDQQRAALERIFFHDVNNTIYGLQGISELIDCHDEAGYPRMIERLRCLVERLTREVAIQRSLSQETADLNLARKRPVALPEVIAELQTLLESHPAARQGRVDLPQTLPAGRLTTDRSLLTRILTNMLVNALEAGAPGDVVKLRVNRERDGLRFSVWNRQTISEDVARRIFQRNFTTKAEAGRGLGTFAMKLFGEKVLGGRVHFDTGPDGTAFHLTLPGPAE